MMLNYGSKTAGTQLAASILKRGTIITWISELALVDVSDSRSF